MAQERTAGTAPPIAAYGAVWLLTLASVLVVQLARVTEFSAAPFLVLLTLGTLLSAWASRFPLSENIRFALGVADGALAFLALMGQSYLNSFVGLGTDPTIETYLSLSFLWYLCLRSALMVSMSSLVFQSVPALALFGLVATYMLATQVLWLFVLMLLSMLFLMLASHRLEWGRPERLETGYALRTVFATGGLTGIVAFLLTPLMAHTAGQLISTMVVGMPFRPNLRSTLPSETMPELQVGAGAASLSKMEVMRVRMEGAAKPSYLRMESYNAYTGRGWNRGRVFYEAMFSPRAGVFSLARPYEPPPSQRVTATISLSNGWHRSLYVPGYPLEIAAPVRDLYYVRPIGAVVSPNALSAGERYTVTAYWPTEDPRLLRKTPPSPPHYPLALRLPIQLPQSVFRPKLAELARRLTQHQPTQYDKVMALVRYIEQNTAYNLNVEAYPPEIDVVEYFLFEAKQGYCVEFATALAVLCLHADIPARVVSGFILQERDPDTGEYIVREEHRHLWTEVFFDGIGWVAFDATRNAPVVNAGSDAMPQTDELTHQARRQWLQRVLDILIAAMVLAMLSLLVGPRLGIARRVPAHRALRLYQQLVFALRLMGIAPPAVGQTPRAYLHHAADHLRQRGSAAAPMLDALTPMLLEYFYAAPPHSAALEPEVARQTKQIQHQILQELGFARLILRLIDLGRQKVYGS